MYSIKTKPTKKKYGTYLTLRNYLYALYTVCMYVPFLKNVCQQYLRTTIKQKLV